MGLLSSTGGYRSCRLYQQGRWKDSASNASDLSGGTAMSFYEWIRDGVRHAVMMGFSDAVEQLGVPAQNQELNQHLAAVVRDRPLAAAAIVDERKPIGLAPSAGRKRLGKS